MPTNIPRIPFKRTRRGRTSILAGLWLLAASASFAVVFFGSTTLLQPFKRLPEVVRLSVAPQTEPITGGIQVVDGDTVRAAGIEYRLIGFDTPESGFNARCGRERDLAARATSRLRQLLQQDATLERRPCACRSGTEGTSACNYGRLCAVLTVAGRDVGHLLISEGLARSYACGFTNCPPRGGWC